MHPVNYTISVSRSDYLHVRRRVGEIDRSKDGRRRIVVCIDGTMETEDDNTNVHRIFKDIDATYSKEDDWEHVLGYLPGVGTYGPHPVTGALFGYGIVDKILIAYKFICENYRPGDEIWLVGYSRGAFAVRTLSGIIYYVGVLPFSKYEDQKRNEREENSLDKSKMKLLKEAYKVYRKSSKEYFHPEALAIEFRKRKHCNSARIKFMGCFDTVASIGIQKLPCWIGEKISHFFMLSQNGLSNTNVCPNVDYACHAMAIHERRIWFKPTPMSIAYPSCGCSNMAPRVEQVWFPGMHSDIGGKYPEDRQGLKDKEKLKDEASQISLHVLHWMMERAKASGLKFTREVALETQRPVARLACKDSYKSFYKIMRPVDRRIKLATTHCQHVKEHLYCGEDFEKVFPIEVLKGYKSKTLLDYLENAQELQRLHSEHESYLSLSGLAASGANSQSTLNGSSNLTIAYGR
ncbi:hypothetical protein BD560DRAFT_412809 [Blakeslea trispora]|nr:hypothetical protein BD560DRAFT_412809 [Blakeslea trispora]